MTRMRRWPYTFAMALSLLIGAVAVISSLYLDLPLRDPDGFLGPSIARLPLLTLGIIGCGLVVETVRRSGWRNLPAALVDTVKKEWNSHRLLCIGAGLLSFYVCYVAYRNLKSVLPVFRDGTLYDRQLLHLDYWLTGGNSPALLLHDLLGTDIAANVLSLAYLAYLPLVPISLGAFLVLNRNHRIGAWYATTLCLNWVLGTVSYYLLPSVGPAFSRPEFFRALPDTGVTQLQQVLSADRLEFLTNPAGSDSIQGVAAFASLHVSVTFAAALFMTRTNQRRGIQAVTWILLRCDSRGHRLLRVALHPRRHRRHRHRLGLGDGGGLGHRSAPSPPENAPGNQLPAGPRMPEQEPATGSSCVGGFCSWHCCRYTVDTCEPVFGFPASSGRLVSAAAG